MHQDGSSSSLPATSFLPFLLASWDFRADLCQTGKRITWGEMLREREREKREKRERERGDEQLSSFNHTALPGSRMRDNQSTLTDGTSGGKKRSDTEHKKQASLFPESFFFKMIKNPKHFYDNVFYSYSILLHFLCIQRKQTFQGKSRKNTQINIARLASRESQEISSEQWGFMSRWIRRASMQPASIHEQSKKNMHESMCKTFLSVGTKTATIIQTHKEVEIFSLRPWENELRSDSRYWDFSLLAETGSSWWNKSTFFSVRRIEDDCSICWLSLTEKEKE